MKHNSQYLKLCTECFHKRLVKHFPFSQYKEFDIFIKRLKFSGKAKLTNSTCSDCKTHKATWDTDPNQKEDRHKGNSIPWRIYDLLDCTNKELCLDCIDVGCLREWVPYPASFFAKHYIEDMVKTRHIQKKRGTCEWCENRGDVFSIQYDDKKIDNRYTYKTLITIYHVLLMPVPWILMIFISFWLDQYWQPTSLIFSLGLFILFSYKLFLQIFWTSWRYVFDPFVIGLNISVVPIVYCLSFILTTKALWVFYGGQFFDIEEPINDMSWVIYLIDNIIRVVFCDFAEVFGITISKINHNKDSILICSYVFAFRTMLGISVINSIIRGYQIFKSPVWLYNDNPRDVV